MARCTDCDTLLLDIDRKAMEAINAEYRWQGLLGPYDLDNEDSGDDVHCADCLANRAERAQERRDEDYYGGDTPTLAETAAQAMRFK